MLQRCYIQNNRFERYPPTSSLISHSLPPSLSLTTYPSIYLSMHLSIYPSIYLSLYSNFLFCSVFYFHNDYHANSARIDVYNEQKANYNTQKKTTILSHSLSLSLSPPRLISYNTRLIYKNHGQNTKKFLAFFSSPSLENENRTIIVPSIPK